MKRRHFFSASSASLTAILAAPGFVHGKSPTAAPGPRATAGDNVAHPDWDEKFAITVGPKTGKGVDLAGTSHDVIQAAIDRVARMGGGTVQLMPGEYTFRNAVYLASGVRLIGAEAGAAAETILKKGASKRSKLSQDSDWYDQEITLENADGFQVGDGIALQTKNPHNGATDIVKRTLVARSGKRFKLDKALRKNFWTMGESTAASLFPILSGEFVEDIHIENLTLDGNRPNNENLNGNYAGCIFLQDCNRIEMRGVEARDYNGDGISWQICHDVVVENCHSHGHAGLGLHPGSGSQRPLIRNNQLDRNKIGIFFCWGVKNGLAESNRIDGNQFGISIGHRDTDNLIRDNDVTGSTKVGVLFRPERGKAFAPHRNRVENNRIIDSGPADGVAIDVQGEVESITLSNNQIRETRAPEKRVGVRIGKDTRDIQLDGNAIEGVAEKVVDLR